VRSPLLLSSFSPFLPLLSLSTFPFDFLVRGVLVSMLSEHECEATSRNGRKGGQSASFLLLFFPLHHCFSTGSAADFSATVHVAERWSRTSALISPVVAPPLLPPPYPLLPPPPSLSTDTLFTPSPSSTWYSTLVRRRRHRNSDAPLPSFLHFTFQSANLPPCRRLPSTPLCLARP
jgi:hypothetical protein